MNFLQRLVIVTPASVAFYFGFIYMWGHMGNSFPLPVEFLISVLSGVVYVIILGLTIVAVCYVIFVIYWLFGGEWRPKK